MSEPRLQTALERIDAANAEDPKVELVDGQEHPKALLYAQRMTSWLHRLEPEPSEALQLAVRAQHLRRWTLPRGAYPEGRRGYLAWRRACQELHAQLAAEILRSVAFPEPVVERVGDLIRKQRLKADPEAQALEDAACLVFLESDFSDFATRHEAEKLVEILRKTWRKMSPKAQVLALGLELTPQLRKLVERALDSSDR